MCLYLLAKLLDTLTLKEVLDITVDESSIGIPAILISVNIIAGLEHISLPLGRTPSHAYNVQLLPEGISLKHLVKLSWLLRERS